MSLSSHFTQPDTQPDVGAANGPPPPLIGALLRFPFETVRDRTLAGLHQRGYTDLIAAHLDVVQYPGVQYPGPEKLRPIELAAQARMSKQALNYLLGQFEQLGYFTRNIDERDQHSKRIHAPPRGLAVGQAIREIVLELEAEWAQQLGPRSFAQLRDLLSQLHAISTAAPADTD